MTQDFETLVFPTEMLFVDSVFYSALDRIRTANDLFGLGIDDEAFELVTNARAAAASLRQPYGEDTGQLLYIAIAQKLTRAEKDKCREDGLVPDPRFISDWRDFGFPEIADHKQQVEDLAQDIEIHFEPYSSGSEIRHYAEIANFDEIDRRWKELAQSAAHHFARATLSQDCIAKMVVEKYDLDLRNLSEFNTYWTSRIQDADGFSNYQWAPQSDAHETASGRSFGWLSEKHQAALQAHGYQYRFLFWGQEIDLTRGHMWMQTDQGPLVMMDRTDVISRRTCFPVPVSGVDGTPLFDLVKADVAKGLMRQKALQAAHGARSTLTRIWNAVSGRG